MRLFPYILSGAFALVGLAIAAYGLAVLERARRSASWPSTPGVVTESGVTRGDDSHSPSVAYTYTAGGAPRRGTGLVVGPTVASSTEDYAVRRLARYPVGAAVAVYYDPAAPGDAVLEPGLAKRSFVPLAFGLLFASFGGWFGLLWWLCND